MKKVSIKDIANITGVSTATVSRVINNNGRFSEETRLKVEQAIKDTGYQTNFNAKSLRINKSYSVGILVPDITNSFFGNVVKEIEIELFNHDYSTIIASTGRNPQKEYNYIDMLTSKMIDGLIIISGLNYSSKQESVHDIEVPFICIDRELNTSKSITLITSDHYQGGIEAAKAFAETGIKKPLIIVRDTNTTSTMERIEGFRHQLINEAITFGDEQIFELHSTDTITIRSQIKTVLERNKGTDGIFAANDEMAALILKVAQNMDIKVPEDLQIIGFDNSSISKYTNPSLSTIEQNTEEIAKTAVKYLLNEIDGSSPKERKKLIPVRLIKRGSLKKNN